MFLLLLKANLNTAQFPLYGPSSILLYSNPFIMYVQKSRENSNTTKSLPTQGSCIIQATTYLFVDWKKFTPLTLTNMKISWLFLKKKILSMKNRSSLQIEFQGACCWRKYRNGILSNCAIRSLYALISKCHFVLSLASC